MTDPLDPGDAWLTRLQETTDRFRADLDTIQPVAPAPPLPPLSTGAMTRSLKARNAYHRIQAKKQGAS